MSEYYEHIAQEWPQFTRYTGERIVRCRDCKFCMAYMAGAYCDYMAHAIEPDGFCAWGRRKEGRRSMLTAQVDELREAAVICNLAGERETARLLREAVYTIESLRDRLQAATLEERKDVWCTSEETVRCRNCKHYYEAENYHPNGNYVSRCCKYFDTYNDEVEPDGFCAWGRRKEGRRSMLTAQVDELREAAVICNLAGERETARLLREAVYTIESLRDRLQAATLEERKDDGE